ncbi:MAG: SIS domain-containing protein [Clostridia bacterium]|nr:SIS domain-containing protein [Clostridia bacterium]
MMKELLERYPSLTVCEQEIKLAAQTLITCYESNNKVLTCGNGGSCADADHIVGELMKGFLKKRPLSTTKKEKMKTHFPDLDDDILNSLQEGLPAVSLCSLTALNTAFCNDVNPEFMYAQAVLGLGNVSDVLICLSTSGNSKNVCAAAKIAKAQGIFVIGMTGKNGGKLSAIADVCICVPESETFKVQELHLPVYHYLCATVENEFFEN